MTFKQMVKEDDAFTECSNDGLCLGIIQMGSNFQTVSLVLPQESVPGDVPFIFSGIDDFIEYIENGLTSSSSIFLQFPAEFDYSNSEHMVLFKRSRQKSVNLCPGGTCPNLASIKSEKGLFVYIDSQRSSKELFSTDEEFCKHLCKSNPKCFAVLLRYWSGLYRCALYIQGETFQLTLHSTLEYYDYGRGYTNQDFYYKDVESTCGTNVPIITVNNVRFSRQ